MSFHSLRHLNFAPRHDNSTQPGLTHLPTSILDALIPGYSVISKYLLDIFGFDISIIVSVLVLGFAGTTGINYLYRHMWENFLEYFTASVVIDAYDVIYDNLMRWAAEQEDLKRVRSLKVQSADYTDDIDDLKLSENANEGSIFNFNNWAAKVAPRYEPDSGYHWFRHKGHWFKFSRERNKVQGGWMGMMIHEEELVRLTVLGRSTDPIKELILDTRDRQISKQTARTTVRRPSPKEQRGRGRQAWNKVAVRPSRPMGTVVLESKQKAAILRDINDFLDPATCRWYSNRGLAYRRGYLLSGPPGTGKTSLSFALAGVFGLDIYCMSLSEKTLSEEDLILLFNSLPKRCIVLLEDIDSAGVTRKKEPEKEDKKRAEEKEDAAKDAESKKDGETETTATVIAKEVAKAVKEAKASLESSASSGRPSGPNDMGITMSGLLNAIDGVASQEGRVLIMTTNHPERLDDALIRPGRVDMKVEFTLANREQIRELFLRMYCVDSREAARMPTNLRQIMPDVLETGKPADRPAITEINLSEKPVSEKPTSKPPPTPPRTPVAGESPRLNGRDRGNTKQENIISLQGTPSPELEKMADQFADHLPEATFSPAEVQGFLIMRKQDPSSSVSEVATWRDAELAKRAEKSGKADGKSDGKDEKTEKGKGGDRSLARSEFSGSDDLVKIKKEDADEGDRGEDRGGDVVGGSDEQEVIENRQDQCLPETGSSALLGNTVGIQDGDSDDGASDDGNSDRDGDSDSEDEPGDSDVESEASGCSDGSGRGSDDD